MAPNLNKTVVFLESIGITCTPKVGATGVLKHVRILDGGLHFDGRVAVEDMLHDAGHLAIIPDRYRRFANVDLTAAVGAMSRDLEAGVCEVDSPLMRAVLQSTDSEATAWAWAAGTHLSLPPKVIISNAAYGGDGAVIRLQLQLGKHLGIHGLWHSDMCARPSQTSLPQYPNLLCWTQKIGSKEADCFSPYADDSARPERTRAWG